MGVWRSFSYFPGSKCQVCPRSVPSVAVSEIRPVYAVGDPPGLYRPRYPLPPIFLPKFFILLCLGRTNRCKFFIEKELNFKFIITNELDWLEDARVCLIRAARVLPGVVHRTIVREMQVIFCNPGAKKVGHFPREGPNWFAGWTTLRAFSPLL